MFNSVYEVKIEGKDLKRFIKTLRKKGIELLNISYGENSIFVRVDKANYNKLLDIKTIYEVTLTNLYGLAKYKYLLKTYSLFIFFVVLGFSFLFFLSNVIFDVEVVHRKPEIRNLINKELKRYKIEKYNFVKTFDEQEEIVRMILENNKDKLEWLEIQRIGVKYVVRVEERIINDVKDEVEPRHLVAEKDGIIMNISASHGEVVKKIGDFVKKGDIIVSGYINKNDEVKNIIAAEGEVYAEVWYETTVSMPLVYKEEYKTGKNKKSLVLTLLNKEYSLFDFFPYKDKEKKETIIIKNNILPIKLSFNKEYELKVIDEVYTFDEAISKAVSLAREKLSCKLVGNEEILYEKKLKTDQNNSTIMVRVFFKVYENITSYEKIIMNKDLEG